MTCLTFILTSTTLSCTILQIDRDCPSSLSLIMPASPLDMDTAGVSRAKDLFVSTFNEQPTLAVAAPGRVNLIGEHVDYNEGFVFPLALEKSTYIVGKPVPEGDSCEVIAEAFPGAVATFGAGDTPVEDSLPSWARYVKGMTAIYARNGHKIVPFRASIVSDVPLGSGLSSSAALEMATAVLLETLADLNVDPSDRAKMGQTCEHEFAGVPCGIMDQLISSRGQAGHALLIDCRSHQVQPVTMDHPDAVVVIINSCVTHELSGSEYSSRKQECYDAAAAIAAKFPDASISYLRDCTMEMLEAVKDELPEDTVKRARHVISEDIRTQRAVKCLQNGDLEVTGKLMHESHVSLRDLFQVSTTEIDNLVNIAMEVDGVYGSRITGGGFGGCTVTLVKKDAVQQLMIAVSEQYNPVNENPNAMFATRAGNGARVVTELLA